MSTVTESHEGQIWPSPFLRRVSSLFYTEPTFYLGSPRMVKVDYSDKRDEALVAA